MRVPSAELTQIKAANVARLGLAWSMDLPGEATLEATPLAVHGTPLLYGQLGRVYAVDARDGKLLWKYDPQTWAHNPMKLHFTFAANRGCAYADGRIYLRRWTADCLHSMPGRASCSGR